MFCKECGNELSNDAKFCKKCGVKIERGNTDHTKEYINNLETVENKSENFDEKFIKAYIGDKSDKMYNSVKNGGLNIWAILFGIGYFAYRKMYLVSIITIIISNMIVCIVPSIGNGVATIIGLMFCPLYKWDITRKLRKIKNDNPNVSEEQLIEMAKDKGGTSVVASIGFLIGYFLILFFYFLILDNGGV